MSEFINIGKGVEAQFKGEMLMQEHPMGIMICTSKDGKRRFLRQGNVFIELGGPEQAVGLAKALMALVEDQAF